MNIFIDTGSGGGSDPNFANVTLLVHADSGTTTVTDFSASAFTITDFAGATSSSTQSKFGGASMSLVSTGDAARRYTIAADTNAGFDFGGGDFTIECWVYRDDAGAGGRHILDAWSGRFLFRFDNASTLQFFAAGVGSPVLSASPTLNTGNWYFMTVQRSGSDWCMWVDGVVVNTASNASAINSTNAQLHFGNSNSGDSFGGYIDEVRFTKGVARYTHNTNFTPPTEAFPNS